MPSRRWHQKSHHGCAQCKARKVKCDETRPVCRNCMRQSRICQYSSQLSFLGPSQTPHELKGEPQYGSFKIQSSPLNIDTGVGASDSSNGSKGGGGGGGGGGGSATTPSSTPTTATTPGTSTTGFSSSSFGAINLSSLDVASAPTPPQLQAQLATTVQNVSSFPPNASSVSPVDFTSTPTSTASFTSNSFDQLPFGRDGLDFHALSAESRQEIELMHYWTRSTSLTLCHEAGSEHVWQDDFPRESFSHSFLMHGLLATAAIHLALSKAPEVDSYYNDVCIRHHTKALTLYIRVLKRPSPYNCHALFAFSAIAPVISFGVAQASDHGKEVLVQDFYEIFQMLKGIWAVLDTATATIVQGPFGSLIKPMVPNALRTVPKDAEESLQRLLDRVVDVDEDDAVKKAYHSAIEAIREGFRGGPTVICEDRTIAMMWPIVTPKTYMESLNAQKPFALAILAHYAIFLDALRHWWWAGNLGSRLVSAIDALVGEQWRDLLSWTKEVTGRSEPFRSPELMDEQPIVKIEGNDW